MTDKATSGPICFLNDKIKTDKDVMDCCRVCMNREVAMTNIFDGDNNIVHKILFCTGIEISNVHGLPTQVCQSCLEDLSAAYRFKTSFMLANNLLQKFTKTRIKTENSDEEADDAKNCIDNVELEPDVQDETVLKLENKRIGECTDVKIVVDDSPEWKSKKNDTKQKKRGPFKKSGKLKRGKKNVQPKVKKKASRDPYKDKTEVETDLPNEYCLKRLRCEPCALEFDTRELADAHREKAHKGDAQSWVCEMCGAKFAHRGSLSTHIRSHFPPAFACQQCNYRASHKYDLTKHQRIHAGDRPFQCEMCPASFYDTSNLNSHIRRNHQKVMNFRCEVCGRGFYDRSKLNRHVDSHNNIKRHECSQCHTAFTRLSYLKTHLRKRHDIVLPPLRPGPQRRNLMVDVPPVEYVKPTLIAVKQDTAPS